MFRLKIESGKADQDVTTKATHAMLMSLALRRCGIIEGWKSHNQFSFAGGGGGTGRHTLWKPGLEMCKHAGREPFGILMVHSWGEHRPEQWGEKTQNRVEQCLRAWLNRFQWMGMWVKTRYSRMIPGNFATWLHEFWSHRLGKASLGCKRVRLHRLNFSYQWEMSHGLLIYGPGGKERDHAWRLSGEQ